MEPKKEVQNKPQTTSSCCSDGKVEESKSSGCGCAPTCCSDGDVEKSKKSGCGC